MNQGQPTRNDGRAPSLRGLYCHWIDQTLGEIEANAAAWAVDAQISFDRYYPVKNDADASAWRDKAFGARGFATVGQMMFPRPQNLAAGASPYGACGNPGMTFDAGGNPVTNLGSPLAP
jgi:hypothetical protein